MKNETGPPPAEQPSISLVKGMQEWSDHLAAIFVDLGKIGTEALEWMSKAESAIAVAESFASQDSEEALKAWSLADEYAGQILHCNREYATLRRLLNASLRGLETQLDAASELFQKREFYACACREGAWYDKDGKLRGADGELVNEPVIAPPAAPRLRVVKPSDL